MGIRGQLALLVPGVVALSLMGLAFATAQQRRRAEIEEMRLRSERVLDAIGVTAAVHVAQNDMAGLDTLIAQVSENGRYPDLEEIAVLDVEGRVLAHSRPQLFNTLADDSFSHRAITSAAPLWERRGAVLRVAVPASSGLRWATVTATFSLLRVEQSVAAFRVRLMWTAVAVAALLGLGLFLALDRLVVRPLRVLQRMARRMGEGALDTRVPPLAGRELSELSETFNKMASALNEEHDNLERKVAARTAELEEANRQLEKLAVTDGLTSVYNHRRFQEVLAQEVSRSSRTKHPLSVLMIDVDHFKRFNDSMGHPAGDELLRHLASIFTTELRANDLLARYGGEEFAVILPETDKVEAVQVAERLRAAVDVQLNRAEGPRVSVSIGVASYAQDGDAPRSLLTAADRALYAAKNRGRNRVVAAQVAA
ncbi:MAG: diguanylate cyclase [Myxococcota bacterium]